MGRGLACEAGLDVHTTREEQQGLGAVATQRHTKCLMYLRSDGISDGIFGGLRRCYCLMSRIGRTEAMTSTASLFSTSILR